MKKLTATILLVFAYLMLFPLLWLNKKVVRRCYKNTNGYDHNIAYKIDVFANHNFAPMWNYYLLTSGSKHHFGHSDESLSSVLGKNQREETLNSKGKGLRKIVDWSDRGVKNHCLTWIRSDINFKHDDFKLFKKK